MTKEQLIVLAKKRVRTSTTAMDDDIGQLVAVALTDLKRIGVDAKYLDETNISDPLIIEAALLYTKANFGNPPNGKELMASYDMICTKIKGGGYCGSSSETGN